jgi:predicted HicB family RNase H-like nuclease
MTDRKPLQLRLPPDVKDWLAEEAERNGSSQNSEVIRALRERMARTTADATP